MKAPEEILIVKDSLRGGRVLSLERTRKMGAEVYALYSTRDGRVRYVGESGDSRLRFKEHLRSWGCLVSKWRNQEWRDGYLVRYAVLDTCDFDRRKTAESEWIWRFPSSDLLNQRKKRSWWCQEEVRPPVIHEIKMYMRRHIFNVEGFRGVHYDSDVGYYRVLIYAGGGISWLTGDETPWDTRSIWFSDLARAVNARDGKYPHRGLLELRRRKDIIASRARMEERSRKEGDAYDW